MLLFNSDVSGNCYKVRLLLAQLDLKCELQEVDVVERAARAELESLVDYSDRAELLADLNPALHIPTLVLDDGSPIAESNAILCYLADGTRLLPSDRFERAKVLQWLFFEQFSHAPYIAGVRFLVAYAGKPVPPFLIDSRRKLGYAALAAMEKHLSGRSFLVADRYTIADIALYAYTHVAHEGGFDLTGFPALGAWLDQVAAQPGHEPITG
jgi:glutathione S-transferase